MKNSATAPFIWTSTLSTPSIHLPSISIPTPPTYQLRPFQPQRQKLPLPLPPTFQFSSINPLATSLLLSTECRQPKFQLSVTYFPLFFNASTTPLQTWKYI